MAGCYTSRVSPFGNLRIKARLPLPEAYRSYATSFIASYRLGIHLEPIKQLFFRLKYRRQSVNK